MSRIAENEVRRTMVRTVCRYLGVGELPATSLVNNMMIDLQKNHGGAEIYVPVKSKDSIIDAVRAAYTGTNMVEICDSFGISKATFYRYVGKKTTN